jgi:CO/xanthine dehydrogenase Mo-binding subunit
MENHFDGSPPLRNDILEKATGEAKFVSDIKLPGMAHGRILRSPLPHALIKSIDITRAQSLPGVIAILTGKDLASLNAHWGLYLNDRPIIAIDKVRHVGEPVAMVAACDERTAENALELIDVEYDTLPHVTGEEEALAPDAPLVHENMDTLKDFYFSGQAKPVKGTNIFQKYNYAHGEAEKALQQADHVFDDTFTFPMVFHYAMEPHCVVASYDNNSLTLWSCAQSPSAVQKVLSRIFNLPLASVRVISPYVGGGYGGKGSVKIDPLVAALAWKIRGPVRVCLSISESMLTCRRLSASIRVRTGVRNDGTIVAKSVRVLMNGGAYADTGPAVAVKAANRSIGPYRIPNLELEAIAVYTNTVPGAAFRSIGGPQAVWATESQMDMIADKLGIDPIELRMRNMLPKGAHVRPDLRPIDVDMADMLSQALAKIRAKPHASTAIGAAVAASDPGILLIGGAILHLKIDGSILVSSGSVEIGQGVRGVLRKFAADALRQPPQMVTVLTPDTATAPFDWGTGASRSSVVMGLAIQEAALDITAQLRQLAQTHLGIPDEQFQLVPGGVSDGAKTWTFAELLHRVYGIDSGELIGVGRITPQYKEGKLAQAPLFWETAAGVCSIDVDEDTGQVRIPQYVSCADVGKVLNRPAAEGQDEGAAVQAIGHTFSEELIYEDGQPINASMIDYHVPTIDEVPEDFTTLLIESGDGPGVGGARGMGEGAILPLAPAVANALASRYGIRIRELPMTPEKVWRALRNRKGER